MELLNTVNEELSGAFGKYAGRVRQLSETLSDEQFWTKPYPYGNSFGHLVLHVTGNLNHYVGAQIAETGYTRDREREFADTARPPKEHVLASFDRTVEMVLGVLEAQTEESLIAVPHESGRADFSNRFAVLFHCTSHLNHHLGQMIYLEKELHRAVR